MNHPARLPKILRRTLRTPLQGYLAHIREESKVLKALKQSATVYYQIGNGISLKDLPPLRNINHHLKIPGLFEAAIKLTNPDACPGVDGLSLDSYCRVANPAELITRVRSRLYRPKENLWIEIPKGDGTNDTRTLGIPCVEDRVVQRMWLLVAEQAFERRFLDCSYGYRPGRNCHQAISEIATELERRGPIWVLDADIKAFFDSVPHLQLVSFIKRYVSDPVFLEFCERTLKASEVRDTIQRISGTGVPQGGVISPLFANLFLHEVLDIFFEEVIRHLLNGWSKLFRYADDFVVLTESFEDAELVLKLVGQRIEQFGLTLHPAKTSIRNMTSPKIQSRRGPQDLRELTFLGYELSWHQIAKDQWELAGRTAPGRREKALRRWREDLDAIGRDLKQHRREHRGCLSRKLIEDLSFKAEAHICGYDAFYCAEGNQTDLLLFEESVYRLAAAFWKRHVSARGSNPFEDVDRIWPLVRMRKLCELSNKY